jgi:hypothetical protein
VATRDREQQVTDAGPGGLPDRTERSAVGRAQRDDAVMESRLGRARCDEQDVVGKVRELSALACGDPVREADHGRQQLSAVQPSTSMQRGPLAPIRQMPDP